MPWKDLKRRNEYIRQWRQREENIDNERSKARIRAREKRLKDPDKFNAIRRSHYYKQKEMVFDHYGRTCKCCGESNPVFLTIDHINGGGTQHVKNEVKGEIYPWIVRHGYPEGFQVLCYNCNCAKRDKKHCPHENMDYSDRYGFG